MLGPVHSLKKDTTKLKMVTIKCFECSLEFCFYSHIYMSALNAWHGNQLAWCSLCLGWQFTLPCLHFPCTLRGTGLNTVRILLAFYLCTGMTWKHVMQYSPSSLSHMAHRAHLGI